MTFKNKAIELASEAKMNVGKLSTELQQSNLLDKARTTLSDNKEKVFTVDASGIKLMNFFGVFSLSALLISTYFPLTRIMGTSMPLSEITPRWLYVIGLLALLSHLLGMTQVVSRSLLALLIVTIGFTVYQQVANTLQTVQMFGHIRIGDVLTIALRSFGLGFYLFLISFILVIVSALKSGYQTNSEFWNKLIQQ